MSLPILEHVIRYGTTQHSVTQREDSGIRICPSQVTHRFDPGIGAAASATSQQAGYPAMLLVGPLSWAPFLNDAVFCLTMLFRSLLEIDWTVIEPPVSGTPPPTPSPAIPSNSEVAPALAAPSDPPCIDWDVGESVKDTLQVDWEITEGGVDQDSEIHLESLSSTDIELVESHVTTSSNHSNDENSLLLNTEMRYKLIDDLTEVTL